MEYYKYYLCVGLGSWLMAKVVDTANPHGDLGFIEEIISFLSTILLWPISLGANYFHSLRMRKMEQEILKEMEVLMKEYKNSSITPPESPESVENDKDGTQA